MINKGVSEQLLSLEIDVTKNDKFGCISEDVYAFMQKHMNPIHRSMYVMIETKAKIKWRNNVDIDDFGEAYNRARLDNNQPIDESRVRDILDYSSKIKGGTKFPRPILRKQNDHLAQIDGARRIMATLLAGKNEIDIVVLIDRHDLKSLIEPEFVQQIHDLHLKQKWFKNYQELIELGLDGSRKFGGRFPSILDFSLFEGKTVVDFGCSNGMSVLQAYYCGASRVIGFEYVQENVDIINAIGKRFKIPVEAHRIDFNEVEWENQVLSIIPEWDYSSFLSVYRTKELKDRVGLVKFIWNNSKIGLVFEGHSHPQVDTQQFYQKLFDQLDNIGNIKMLPKGIIERPYDLYFRPKYLLTKPNG
jgi:hypothetical protein